MLEAIATAVVGAALLWLVLQPMLFPHRVVDAPIDPIDPEETARGRALLALKEIEFDRATGKLSDEDYAALNAKYSAAAIAALDEGDAPRCGEHGARTEPDARFCPVCGAGLVRGNACAACGATIPDSARFCPGCGAALRGG